ncbi:MAG: PKD domain-containing protein [Candidatus Riflebacteria bacterium]|nr:PKD domain-containing protein [Candidatus Riflebacteria bacterium]
MNKVRNRNIGTTMFLFLFAIISVAFCESIGESPLPSPRLVPIDPPSSIFQSIQLAGFRNDWNLNTPFGKLKNIRNSLWQGFEYFEPGEFECLFAANNSWRIFWGMKAGNPPGSTEDYVNGTLIPRGQKIPIRIISSGPYQILFDDKSGLMRLNLADGRLVPIANAGPDQIVRRGEMVRFTAAGSYDIDGSIATYSWSNGLAGISPFTVYDEPGEYHVTLTVSDNSGNQASDTVLITVKESILVEADFRRETIYAVPLSRFYDADPDNNFYCRAGIQKGDPHWRGDFKGMIEKLDYIVHAGFSAIMITPPVDCRGELDFLGYNAYDWKRTDSRLESSDAKYYNLIESAHSKGLKIVQEIVVNHSSNYGIRGEYFIDRLPHKFFMMSSKPAVLPYIFNWGNYKHPFREDNDNPRAPEWFQDFLFRDPWAQGPLIDPRTGTSLPKNDYRPERFFGTDESTLSSEWYHRKGWFSADLQNNTEAVQFKHQDNDSIDLATENWKVKNYLNEAVFRFIDLGVDGFMIKFARNVPREDILFMVDEWKKYKRDLFVAADVESDKSISEVLSSLNPYYRTTAASVENPTELMPWWYTRIAYDTSNPDSGRDSKLAVCDYQLLNTFGTTILKSKFSGLGKLLAMDWIYGDPTTLVTFFHGRTRGPSLGADRFKRFAGQPEYAALAYTLLFTARGIPCIQMGEEIEFQKGMPLVADASSIMLSQSALAYFGENLSPANYSSTVSNRMFQHIQRLNMIRKLVPALQIGKMLNGRDWNSGISFIRKTDVSDSVAVVALSLAEQEITVSGISDGLYSDAISGNIINTASNTLTFQVAPFSAAIWVKNGPGKIGEGGYH